LDDAPDDPESILLFGALNLILNNVLVDHHPSADIAMLKFYIDCHCDIGRYTVPPDICAAVNFSTPAVRLDSPRCSELLKVSFLVRGIWAVFEKTCATTQKT